MLTDKTRLWSASERGAVIVGGQAGRRAWLKIGALRTLFAFMCGFLCAFGMFLLYDNVGAGARDSSSIFTTTMRMSEELTLAAHLEHEVRVLCMVLTYPDNYENQVRHVRATWGKRCSKLIFVSSQTVEDLDVVQVIEPANETYDELYYKTREGLRYIHDNYLMDYDWFLKADDDTYVIMENLRLLLWSYTGDMPIYFGYKMQRYGAKYMSGGTSYVLSREALRRFMAKSYGDNSICPAARKYGIEDFYIGICLQNVGVRLADVKHALLTDDQAKMFPLDIRRYFTTNDTEAIPTWLHAMTVSSIETGPDCCSPYSIAFHYVSPEFMEVFDFLIYRLRPFGLSHTTEQLPIRLNIAQIEDMYPLEQNDDIKDLNVMIKPDNF